MAYRPLNEEQPAGEKSNGTVGLGEEEARTDLIDVHLSDGEERAGAGGLGDAPDNQVEEEEEEEEGDTVTLLRDYQEEDEEIKKATEDGEPGRVTISDSNVQITTSQSHKFKWVRYALGVGAFVLLFAFLATAITLIAVAPPCRGGETPNLEWWKTTIIYQCYPRSFQDSNNDGDGDLRGIMNRTDYFVEIGVKTVWLNPIFKSPQRDGGYDISDFYKIDGLYGTMEDLKALLDELHSKGIRLLLDFVPNHTSDEHPWFVESRKNRTNPKRDWYVWADGQDDGSPPNNWISVFGGSAWTYDNATNQYYLHQFSDYQPDLNYRNREVKAAMEEVLKFWLELGVDGFRFDAVKHLLEDPALRDEARANTYSGPPNCTTNISSNDCYSSLVHNLTTDYPGIHDIIRSWRRLFDSYEPERFMVGEIYDPPEVIMSYYGENGDEFNFPFNFFLLGIDSSWTGVTIDETISSWLDNMPEGAWPNWVLGNHDNPRVATRVGNYLAAAMNVLLLTLPGTPTTYYGEEIFMTNNKNILKNQTHDPAAHRDGERTPMQWDDSTHAGFTSENATPWLPLPANSTVFNVQVERNDNRSMLALYKKLSELKSKYAAFQFTDYAAVQSTNETFAYTRYHESSSDRFIIVINFSLTNQTVDLDSAVSSSEYSSPSIYLSTKLNRTGSVDLKAVGLGPGEALVIAAKKLSCA
jgi:glycosidase